MYSLLKNSYLWLRKMFQTYLYININLYEKYALCSYKKKTTRLFVQDLLKKKSWHFHAKTLVIIWEAHLGETLTIYIYISKWENHHNTLIFNSERYQPNFKWWVEIDISAHELCNFSQSCTEVKNLVYRFTIEGSGFSFQ